MEPAGDLRDVLRVSRYEQERKKRDVYFKGKRIGRRQATGEEAARELNAAFYDFAEQAVKQYLVFVRKVNAAMRHR